MVNSTEVSILHGFAFPTYCNSLETSEDNKTVLATGGYKPMSSVFDLSAHTLKFERHSDHELIKGVFIGEDWTKIALLTNTAKVEFHSQFGKHDLVSLPQQCRDIKADQIHGAVVLGGKSGSVYRFSMESGKFLPVYDTKISSVEEVAINKVNTLCAVVGGSSASGAGICEFIDYRDGGSVASFSIDSVGTSCVFSEDGLICGIGTQAGHILLYDLRSPVPLIKKDHNYDFKIKKVEIKKRNVLSLDQKGVKVWESSTGKVLAAIQPSFDANAFTVSEGIVFIGGNTEEMKTYYVPSLGPIPEWCSSLEGATEEMDEIRKSTYYEQYRFITEEELVGLNLQKEVGKKIRPHMHGYLVPNGLYDKYTQSKPE